MNERILVVDDNVDSRSLMERIVQKNGCEALLCSSSQEAKDAIGRERIDLIVLDVAMPGESGLELLRWIRSRRDALGLPVIMVTGKASADDVLAALRTGANDYITKPIHGEITWSRIETQLKLSALARLTTELTKSETLRAMIATYNHEINNPLAIAMANLEKVEESHLPEAMAQPVMKVRMALGRIADIVKKIKDVDETTASFESYAATKILKLGSK